MNDEHKKRSLLSNSRLFKDFSPEVMDAIIPLLTVHHFEMDNLICLKGDESDCLYIIRDGEAEISVSSGDGKVILLGTLSTGDVFGEIGLLDQGERTANVTAKTDISLYRLDNKAFNELAESFGVNEFMALTSYICFLFRSLTNNLEDIVFLDASVRIAKKIQNLYSRNQDGADGNSFNITISQENLGRMAGLSREATNKALSHLEGQGLIELQYKRIIVPDMDKFRKATNDDV